LKRLSLITLFLSVTSFAQTSTNILETDISSPRFLERIKPDGVTHWSMVNGPGLSGRASDNFNSDGTKEEGSISGWHQVSLQYQLNDKTRFVVNPRFTTNYNDPEQNSARPVANLTNPVLGIVTTWYENGNFAFRGGVNTVFWTFEDEDQQEGLIANPGGFNSVSYRLNNSFTVGSWLWGRYNYRTNADNDAPIFLAPFVRYSPNDNFFIQPFYQWNGEVSSVDTTTMDTDDNFNLLFSFRINNMLTLQPMITLFRDQDFNLAKGNINMWVSGRFF
jgi:hypothetical protein